MPWALYTVWDLNVHLKRHCGTVVTKRRGWPPDHGQQGQLHTMSDRLTWSYPTFPSHIFPWFGLHPSLISCTTTNYRSWKLEDAPYHVSSTIKQYICHWHLVFKVSNKSVDIFFSTLRLHKLEQHEYECTASGFQVVIHFLKNSFNFFQYSSPSLILGASTIDRLFQFSSFYSIVYRLWVSRLFVLDWRYQVASDDLIQDVVFLVTGLSLLLTTSSSPAWDLIHKLYCLSVRPSAKGGQVAEGANLRIFVSNLPTKSLSLYLILTRT